MYKIYDGRESFYQWDLDRKLIVADSTIDKVYFCNRTGDCSLVRNTYEINGMYLVDVPNVLLQQDWRINVYGYDGKYTKHSARFEVITRSKPEDYVYTDEELMVWEQLEERINEIEEAGVSQEVVDSAIEKYFEENPIEVPTVDLTGYATEEYVDNAIANIEIPSAPETDLSGYYTKTEIDNKGFQTAAQVQTTVESAQPDLSGYALKTDIPTVPDLDPYALKTDIPDVSGYALKSEIPTIPDLEPYALKSEIPDVSGYALKTDIPTVPDLEPYALKSEIPDVSGYATQEYVQEYVAENGSSGAVSWNDLEDKPFYTTIEDIVITSDDTITATEYINGYYYAQADGLQGSYTVASNKDYYVIFDDVEYTLPFKRFWYDTDTQFNLTAIGIGNQSLFLPELDDTGEPFFVKFSDDDGTDSTFEIVMSYSAPIYCTTGGEHTIAIKELAPNTTIVPLPERYLPEIVVTVDNIKDYGYQTEAQVEVLIDTALNAIGVAEDGAY